MCNDNVIVVMINDGLKKPYHAAIEKYYHPEHPEAKLISKQPEIHPGISRRVCSRGKSRNGAKKPDC